MTSEFLSEKYRIQNDILLQEIGGPDVCDEKKQYIILSGES